jgi:uncharacterized protein YbgA (DUF1722 family)/uncharacterized protein YbbK (DUF523 family)
MKVRFDGGHKHDNYITQTLGRYFEWIDVCPEVEIGMGVPRESIRLTGDPGNQRLTGHRSGTDYTDVMKRYALKRLDELEQNHIHGYILKKDSPSCGLQRVRIYTGSGMPVRTGTGLFAQALLEKFPMLPVEEEGRLNDFPLRENFIERVFAHHRLSDFMRADPGPGDLVRYHTRHKLTIMSHSQKAYTELGRIVAQSGNTGFPRRLSEYCISFMQALGIKATRKKHVNVLYHITGFFKDSIDKTDKEELTYIISQYHRGIVPLIVPLTLIRHHLLRNPVDWIGDQVYLNPYPEELMLRNFI